MTTPNSCSDCEQNCLNQFVPEEELNQSIYRVEYEPGETIIKQGSLIQNRYLLCQGKVKLGTRNAHGKQALFSLISEPEIIEKSCLHSERDHYQINAVAVTNATVGIISLNEFQRLIEKYPEISDYLAEEISKELDFQLQKSAMNRWGGAKENLFWLLVSLYEKLNHDGKDEDSLDLHLSERDLADMLGVSRETVVVHMSSLRKKGLARATRGSVDILDYEGLVQAKEEM